MTCFRPQKAHEIPGEFTDRGARVLMFGLLPEIAGEYCLPEVVLPCGKCLGCRRDRVRDWATRCVHEAALHAENCFVTLTYDRHHLPVGGTLVKRDFQLFMKRLRKEFSSRRVRFLAAGEYGSQGKRPHYHAILFGVDFDDKVLYREGKKGAHLYKSALLSRLWGMGNVTLGTVTDKSAAYVAGYTVKKVDDGEGPPPGGLGRYQRWSEARQRVYDVAPEFLLCSLKPGIGAGWLLKYWSDVFPDDFLIVGGAKRRVPRYYRKLLEYTDLQQAEALKAKRVAEAERPERKREQAPERLRVREECARIALARGSRGVAPFEAVRVSGPVPVLPRPNSAESFQRVRLNQLARGFSFAP